MIKDDCNNCNNFALYPNSTKCIECGGSPKNHKPVTHADRIRAMSDEELADMFESWIQDCGCNNVPCEGPCQENIKKYGDKSCLECWLDWLKQEVDT